MENKSDKIDFVITWVDGNDPEWQKEKAKYQPKQNVDVRSVDARNIRYREWDNLQYWFRGIEKFAPWVNKIHFVTYGHLPSWLNTEHPKINIVKHSDYMPEEYLPTFNSRPIELNFHRIKDLSEKFVYFNDDMFLIDNVKQEDFFKNGLPCDMGIISATIARDKLFNSVLYNNMLVINSHFKKNEVIKENFFKWINIKYGKHLIKTFFCLPWKEFIGFYNKHVYMSYLKSTFEEVWNKEYELLDTTSKSKFRKKGDINHFLFQYWQLAEGKFYPKKMSFKFFQALEQTDEVVNAIKKQKYKCICLNDSIYNNENFEELKTKVKNSFEKLFPEKSSFEK